MQKYYSFKNLASLGLAVSIIGVAVGQVRRAQAITLEFDYEYDDNNFFNDTRKATLDKAASYFEPITDNLEAITDDPNDYTDIGPTGYYYPVQTGVDEEGNPIYEPGDEEIINTWTATFSHPSIDGVTQSEPDLTVAEDTLKIYVGAKDLSSLGLGGPGGFSTSGLTDFGKKVKARGQTGALASSPTDFGRWGGSISFDSSLDPEWNWNDDFNDPLEAYEYDLLSVAIHEIGHVLGFGTSPSWNTDVSGSNFIGTNSVQTYGSNVPLTPDGGHWAEGTISYVNGSSQEAAMDPTLESIYYVNESGEVVTAESERKLFTQLDYAGLADVGWQTEAFTASAAVPFEFSPGMGIVLVSGVFGAKKGLQELRKRKK